MHDVPLIQLALRMHACSLLLCVHVDSPGSLQQGKPCVCGAALAIDVRNKTLTAKSENGATHVLHQGDWLSLNGTTGEERKSGMSLYLKVDSEAS
eukprot:1160268-Pelagomonas_calceolata.AAC.7